MGELTKDEKSLLLFLETCAVDFGTVDTRHMNEEDMDIAERWTKEGFITFGRMPFHWIEDYGQIGGKLKTHYAKLGPEAFDIVHRLRRERAGRMETKIDKIKEEY